MKSTRCLAERLNLFCIDDSRFYNGNGIPLSVSLIKGLLLYYYKACIKRVCFVRIDLALG
ncbi:hypothetical protein C2R45_03560 [Helicobacter pylori]|uniref:hypothetical protein n=1 Tax=Helicobacter pylori TaxID=210 RepID=UPI000D333EE9|nr:hypothetical protein [Helicobacter pylori]PUD86730.1 hypothetical protein C2R45_03560 [Helicobacter pylori]